MSDAAARATPTVDEVLSLLRRYQPRAEAIGARFLGVVGSFARGEARVESDIDIPYEVLDEGHLWPLLGITAEMEDQLGGRRIDLIDHASLPSDSWAWMARDLVRL